MSKCPNVITLAGAPPGLKFGGGVRRLVTPGQIG